MNISFTGLTNPHVYMGKEKFLPVKLLYGNSASVDTVARYQEAKFTCDLTNDGAGSHLHRFLASAKLLKREDFVNKENPSHIDAVIGFFHVKGTENRFCKFFLNGKEITGRRSADLYTLNELSEMAKSFGKEKDLSANQRGVFNAMSFAYDDEVEAHRLFCKI